MAIPFIFLPIIFKGFMCIKHYAAHIKYIHGKISLHLRFLLIILNFKFKLIFKSFTHFGFLSIMGDNDPILFFCVDIQFSQNYLFKDYVFLFVWFWELYQITIDCKWLDLFLGFLLCSLSLYGCFCANLILL